MFFMTYGHRDIAILQHSTPAAKVIMATWRTLCFGLRSDLNWLGGGLKGDETCKKEQCVRIWWRPKATWHQRWFIHISVLQRPSMAWHVRESSRFDDVIVAWVVLASGGLAKKESGSPEGQRLCQCLLQSSGWGQWANEHRRCVWCLWCLLFFLRVDSRGLCFFCECYWTFHLLLLVSFVSSCDFCSRAVWVLWSRVGYGSGMPEGTSALAIPGERTHLLTMSFLSLSCTAICCLPQAVQCATFYLYTYQKDFQKDNTESPTHKQ